MNLGVRHRGTALPANRREAPGKSWRAHREIKRYAGGSEHCTVADEWMDAAGKRAAADESESADQSGDTATGADESYRAGASAAGAERYDGTAWLAAGTGSEADRAFVSAGHGRRLFEAKEPHLEPDPSAYGAECPSVPAQKYHPPESAPPARTNS